MSILEIVFRLDQNLLQSFLDFVIFYYYYYLVGLMEEASCHNYNHSVDLIEEIN